MNAQDKLISPIYDSLVKARDEAIERKRRLGQYVVVDINGEPQLIQLTTESTSPADAPEHLQAVHEPQVSYIEPQQP